MHLEFLGTAGYHPSETRHTSCILLPDAAPDEAFVLDAGTGFFRLASPERPLPRRLHIFLTHPHLDHVAGLTFLLDVAFVQKVEVALYANANTLRAVKQTLFGSPLFPLPFVYPTVEISPEREFEVAGVRVNTHPLTHPGGSLAFRFDWTSGQSLCYVTDTAGDGRYHDFISGAPDVLIHERNFPDSLATLADSSGHCTSSALVAAARASGARQVLVTHFNPLTQSDPLEEDDVYAALPGVRAAFDGLKIEF
jgi:ribonuclease Z